MLFSSFSFGTKFVVSAQALTETALGSPVKVYGTEVAKLDVPPPNAPIGFGAVEFIIVIVPPPLASVAI